MNTSDFSGIWWDHADLAYQLADEFRDDTFRQQIVAISLKGSRVIGYGVNQKRHAKNLSVFNDSLHAEADLARKFGEKIQGTKILLYRFNSAPESPFKGVPMCAKPCLFCGHVLRKAGVGKVVFVDESGLVKDLGIEQLPFLSGEPSVLTKRFLEKMGQAPFKAADYLL